MRSSGAGRWIVVGLFVGVLAGVLASGAWARPVTVGEEGTGAGQYREPKSVGVDQSSGAVSVFDAGNHRVDVFGAGNGFVLAWGLGVLNGAQELQKCTSETGCRPAAEHSGGVGTLGAFSPEVGGLAVDQGSGDVWVSDQERIQEFGPSGEGLREIQGSLVAEAKSPLAVDGAGDLWVGESEGVQEFSPTGEHIASVALPGVGEVSALAVTSSGADVYVIGSAAPGVREFETATGSQVGGVIDEAGGPQALALDASGSLFLGGGAPYSFGEYDASGVQVEQFGSGEVIGDPGGVAFGGGSDAIAVESGGANPSLYSANNAGGFVGGTSAVQRFPLPEVGKPLPYGERASNVEPTSATLEASLDPENHPPTSYHFEYGTEPGVYIHSTPTETLSETGFAAETVSAAVTGLLPETTYYFRLSATNSDGTVDGEGASLTTPPAVLIESESALNISSSSVSFDGVLNPQGVSAEWWVEYGTQEGTFDHSTARQPLPAGSEGVGVSVHVQGLEGSTVYHYRFAASDEREVHAYTSYGRTQSFTTQPGAPSFSLLDGRGWEMVSPLNKQGASFKGDSKEGAINQAAVSGAGVTYAATASVEPSPPGEPSPEAVQVLSRRGAGGWGSRDIASPHEQEWMPAVGRFTEFRAFSPDLSVGVAEPHGNTLLGGATEPTPYLRRQAQCEAEATPDACYLPLLTTDDVTSGEKWAIGSASEEEVRYEASTPDLGHVLISSEVPLTSEAGGAKNGLYEWSAGRLELVSVLPGKPGTPTCGRVSEHIRRHVISADGDRVLWGACGEGHLYMREVAAHRTVQLDEVQNGGSGANPTGAGLQDASVDGSRVFFSDAQQLTADSHATNGAPDLYVYEANADSDPEAGVVRDVTVTAHNGEAANVLGTIPGVSEDGSVAYVVATGVLTETASQHGETAQPGQPNLYRIERDEAAGKVSWTAIFIATLSPEDENDWSKFPSGLAHLTASVSANGRWLAFMSERPLTGYDNRDAVSGQRDEEVFLYDAASRRLVCGSCNPTGARPYGVASAGELSLLDKQAIWPGRWLAGMIPGWESTNLGVGVYRSRYLSDSGRLFFDSVDGLAPQDVNGTSDVYEYEPAGVGSCTSVSATYSAFQGGCIGLVSSGISSEEAVFLDASESGNDAFFLTTGKLVAGDTDNAYDVYDAHICGSGWACPTPVAVTPPCTNAASCQQAPESQPAVFGASGSATFSGASNHASLVKHRKAVRCRKKRVRRRGRCVRRYRHRKGSRKARHHRRGR